MEQDTQAGVTKPNFSDGRSLTSPANGKHGGRPRAKIDWSRVRGLHPKEAATVLKVNERTLRRRMKEMNEIF